MTDLEWESGERGSRMEDSRRKMERTESGAEFRGKLKVDNVELHPSPVFRKQQRLKRSPYSLCPWKQLTVKNRLSPKGLEKMHGYPQVCLQQGGHRGPGIVPLRRKLIFIHYPDIEYYEL